MSQSQISVNSNMSYYSQKLASHAAWIANNGLTVKRRTSTSVMLSWEMEKFEDKKLDPASADLSSMDAPSMPPLVHYSRSYLDIHTGTPAAKVPFNVPETSNKYGRSGIVPFNPDSARSSSSKIDEKRRYYEVQMRRADENNWKTIYE